MSNEASDPLQGIRNSPHQHCKLFSVVFKAFDFEHISPTTTLINFSSTHMISPYLSPPFIKIILLFTTFSLAKFKQQPNKKNLGNSLLFSQTTSQASLEIEISPLPVEHSIYPTLLVDH